MRRVIGISETVFDILFRNGKPVAGVPGGSVFNGLITLGRTGINSCVISETGDDEVGHLTTGFMEQNGVAPDYVTRIPGKKSAISLAFLDENNDAHYSFYKDYKNSTLQFTFPEIQKDDIVMFGSYYALNPVLRPKVGALLRYAREKGAILYYDLNFRQNHSQERAELMPTILENFSLADIVRGSSDDFGILFDMTDDNAIWEQHIRPHCHSFIYTMGADGVRLHTDFFCRAYKSRKIQTVSTVGAGDNFNAGIVYGLIRNDIKRDRIATMPAEEWDSLIGFGIEFGTEVCRSTDNYISPEFAERYRL